MINKQKSYSIVLALGAMILMLVNIAGAAPFAYIANGNNVSVVDTATNTITATIAVGPSPYGVAVTPDGTKVYVTNSDDDTISIIDTATNVVTATVSVGCNPLGVAISPDGTRIYVANAGDNTTSIINTTKNTVIATRLM